MNNEFQRASLIQKHSGEGRQKASPPKEDLERRIADLENRQEHQEKLLRQVYRELTQKISELELKQHHTEVELTGESNPTSEVDPNSL